MSSNSVINKKRILYVDPNNIHGDINGNSLTPDYTDYCISFNLVVEKNSRYDISNISTKKYVISWTSYLDENDTSNFTPGNYVSFLQGEDVDNFNFLTTSFTDINYDDIKSKSIVEGLGVESVEVSFTSYYVPTVVIKFVDVRGSSLFGREEAIHSGSKLTADNVFGCFFSLPYPLFRLQIKGFYGKPVTYQLTCSSFKGNFNSQTGNFEAVATFIGYSYSLLTDIPFQYLVAAPYSNYIGAEYWNKKVNSPEWALSGGEKMVKLFQLFNEINEASLKDISAECITSEESEEKKSLVNEKNSLNQILNSYNEFIREFSNISERNIVSSDENCQILFMKNEYDGKVTATELISKKHEILLEYIKKYNESYRTTAFNINDYPNQSATHLYEGIELKFIHMFNITEEDIYPLKGLNSFKFRDNSTLNNDLITKINNIIEVKNRYALCQYGYLLDLNNLKAKIKNRLEKIEKRTKEIEEIVNRRFVESLKNNISVTPTIGNIVKIIMAHLETFIHMVCECGRIIKNQHRTPDELGFNPSESDYLPTDIKTVPPFPAIYNNGTKEEVGDINESIECFAWLGDISDKFEEEKLILGLQGAAQHIKKVEHNEVYNEDSLSVLPIMPCDFYRSDIFGNKDEVNIGTLSGALGIRASQLFGVFHRDGSNNAAKLPVELAELYGKMDAYNYYCNIYDKHAIKNNIFEVSNRNGLPNALVECMLCSEKGDMYGNYYQNSGKTRHIFETKLKSKYNSKGRHPVLVEDGENYKYRYQYVDDVMFVPSEIKKFNRYNVEKQYGDMLYNESDENINIAIDTDKFMNTSLFNVIVDKTNIKHYSNIYNVYKKGSFSLNGKDYNEDFTRYLDKVWKVNNSDYNQYFYDDRTIFSLSYAENELDQECFYPTEEGEKVPKSLIYNGWVNLNNDIKFEEGVLTCKDKKYNIYDLKIQKLNIYNEEKSNSLFGDDFYYLQNNDKDSKDNERSDAYKTYAKCLLFLHSLPYNFNNKPYFNDRNNKMNGSIQYMPYGYILLLGGLLWRHKQNKDCILFNDGDLCDYKVADKNYSLFYYDGKHYSLNKFNKTSKNNYNVPLWQIFGGNSDNWRPDLHIENNLIEVFENFVETKWFSIEEKVELRDMRYNIVSQEYYSVYYDSRQFLIDVESLKSDIYKAKLKPANLVYNIKKQYFANFTNNYRYIYVGEFDNGLQLLLNEENDIQATLRDVFTTKVMVFDNSSYIRYKGDTNKKDVSFKKSLLTHYLKGFSNKLDKLIYDDIGNVTVSENATENTVVQRDLVLPMYMYIKNLWDKWLVNKDEETYYVRNFFKDFVFIDSFYRNIYDLLIINLNKLKLSYEHRAKDGSLYQVLGDIASDHRCLFLSMPDYINLGDEDINVAVENMESLFKPIPYNQMNGIERNNKFIFIYTHKPVDSGEEMNGYSINSYDIWDETTHDLSPIATKIFSSNPTNDSINNLSRYGYNVPSFGVSFASQNNHLFKNIKLDMNNPIDTEQSIIVMSDIARLGAGNNHKISYMGQDTYPIFSNYSYMCEIEMMGDAQIMPLMYFQLMNIPLWRGTYMIYQVSHKLSPGNMITSFKGMKMSCKATPFNTQWFTYVSPIIDGYTNQEKGDVVQNENTETTNRVSSLRQNVVYYKSDDNVEDKFDDKLCRQNCSGYQENSYTHNGQTVAVNQRLRTLYNKLYNDIEKYNIDNNIPDDKKWNVSLSNILRKPDGTNSDHVKGYAMDLKVMYPKRKYPYVKAGSRQEELLIVYKILFDNYKDELRQLILEYNSNGKHMSSPINFHVLHVAVKHDGNNDIKNEFFLADNCGKTVINKDATNKKSFINFLNKSLPEYKKIANDYYQKVYMDKNGHNTFTKTFINFKVFNENELREFFGSFPFRSQI